MRHGQRRSAPDGGTSAPPEQEQGLERRGFLKVAAAGLAAPVIASACPFSAAAAAPARGGGGSVPAADARSAALPGATATVQHASGLPRGLDVAAKAGRRSQGRYGLLFPGLPAYAPPDHLMGELARTMTDPRSGGRDPSDGDQWDNPDITGGYTFLGQFIDHDITRDTTPLAGQRADPLGTRNFSTPALDLHSVYEWGPTLSRHLYDPARRGRLLVDDRDGLADLPRTGDGAALVGDPRNDENLIVAQLHAAFLRHHNACIDGGMDFEQARRTTTLHYQWLVVHEFLPRICGRETVDRLLATGGRVPWYRPRDPARPFMPIEFSAAAYRFGHSMIRPEYEMNDADTGPIFSHPGDDRDDLRGSRPVPSNYRADWTYFFDVPGHERPDGLNFARLIDSRLALPLHDLPETVVPRSQVPLFTDLAERNLLRGKQVGLSSGQDVARAMGLTPLGNDELGLTDPDWGGRAPLWFYVLKEAELTTGGRHLGPVGGQLVAGTIMTLLALDPRSVLRTRSWAPPSDPFPVGSFLQLAGVV